MNHEQLQQRDRVMNTQPPSKNQQHGVVLVISLLVLLVLTLIGVSSLDGSVMEEKMASNSQTAAATFQKAESAIKQTYYVQSLYPANAIKLARGRATVNYPVDNNISSSSVMAYPPPIVGTRMFNSSSGFAAHSIQIIGTADIGGRMQSRNIQGYRIFPMMAPPP